MKLVSTVVIAFVAVVLTGAALVAQSGDDLFQRALVKERTASYEEAIALYQTIVDKHGADKKLVAKALFQLGQAHEKLDKPAEARKAYARIVGELSDQKDLVADANRRLAALTGPTSDVPTTRFVMSARHRDTLNRGSLSPDGRWMVLTDESRDVAIRDMSTGSTVRLGAKTGSRFDPGGAEFLTFSPDMSQVAYTWAERGGKYELRLMPNKVGGKPRVLVSNPEYDFWTAAWFPDGKSILGMVEKPDRTWQLLRINVSDGRSEPIKSLGWRIRAFTGSVRPSISPDGRYIAYAAAAGNPDKPSLGPASSDGQHIYVISADGSGPEIAVVKTASSNDAPAWSPDGRHVLYVSNVTGIFDLWSIAVQSGKPSAAAELVVRGIGDVRPIGMTRSGSYYYSLIRGGRPAQISIADLSAGGTARRAPIRVTEAFVGDDIPIWSPDGQFVAFFRSGNALAPQQGWRDWDLVVGSVTGGHEQVYRNTVQGQLDANIVWLDHDSLLTLPMTQDISNSVWYHVSLKSGASTPITQGFYLRDGRPVVRSHAVSPAGRRLFLVAGDSVHKEPTADTRRVVSIDIDSRKEQEIINLSDRSVEIGGLSASPDGRTLVITTRDPATSRRMAFVGGTDGGIFRESPLDAGSQIWWTRDSKTMLYLASGKGAGNADPKLPPPAGARVVSIDVRTLEQKDLVSLSNGAAPRAQVVLSPDGRRLAIATFDAVASRTGVAVVGVDGTNYREFHVPFEPSGNPVWTSADEVIQVSRVIDNAMRVLRIGMDGREPSTTELSGADGEAFASPDGARVAFRRGGSESNELLAIDNVLRALKN